MTVLLCSGISNPEWKCNCLFPRLGVRGSITEMTKVDRLHPDWPLLKTEERVMGLEFHLFLTFCPLMWAVEMWKSPKYISELSPRVRNLCQPFLTKKEEKYYLLYLLAQWIENYWSEEVCVQVLTLTENISFAFLTSCFKNLSIRDV